MSDGFVGFIDQVRFVILINIYKGNMNDGFVGYIDQVRFVITYTRESDLQKNISSFWISFHINYFLLQLYCMYIWGLIYIGAVVVMIVY